MTLVDAGHEVDEAVPIASRFDLKQHKVVSMLDGPTVWDFTVIRPRGSAG